MNSAQDAADALAAALMAAPPGLREAERQHGQDVPANELAWALKRLCLAAWTADPPATLRAAELVEALAVDAPQPEIEALAAWTCGIALITQGQMEPALAAHERAHELFVREGRLHEAAQTQMGCMMTLSMLGRHDEAVACGEEARSIFDGCGDARSAGKVEGNLGNLAARRDLYAVGARHFSDSRTRFSAAGDTDLYVTATTGLADMLARQHEFERASELYDEALAAAQQGGYAQLIASIEGDLGALEMWRGRYDRALRLLERSRLHYEAMAMPHYLAVAEESLADAYLELNLLPEALALYDHSLASYQAAGMQTDQAWAHSQRGHALALLGRTGAAAAALDDAHALFADEDNPVGLAMVGLWRSELALAQGEGAAAARHARAAGAALLEARHMSWHLHARGLLAQALRAGGDVAQAETVARETLATATTLALPQPMRRAELLLGGLAAQRGDTASARRCFEAAVASIESQRGTLPGEEFRSAFLGDKLQPFHELVRLSLADGGPRAAEQALAWVERARARALADQMDDSEGEGEDSDAAQRELARLRLGLNACYRQLSRPLAEGAEPARLFEEVHRLESALSELGRRGALAASAAQPGTPAAEGADGTAGAAAAAHERAPAGGLDLAALRQALGSHTAVVEYFALDDTLMACVVTDAGVQAVTLAAGLAATARMVEQLRFQTDTLRQGAGAFAHRLPELRQRALHHLQGLHTALWAPLAAMLGARRVVVVPHGPLHYLPFEALFDGHSHEVEKRELCRSPSAGVLLRCLERPDRGHASALVLGHADERLPLVGREVERVAALFPGALSLQGGAATGAALRAHGPGHDLLHIACHAQFRNDSPRFSALHLADGAFTVRDAARLKLRCRLLTLSACETGVSAVMPGDELIGLTYGFMCAGAASVLASLWTVQDEAACLFMEGFYGRLRQGARPAAALRETQCEALGRQPHPYFWGAFGLHGRW